MFTCPACEQTINQASEICPYCGADLAPAPVPGRAASQRRRLLATLVAALILAAAVWTILRFALPRPDVPPRAVAEAGAVAQLRRVAAVLDRFERRQGGYPGTIEQVGTEAGAAYADARRQGYSLIYRAGPPQSDGTIRSFALLARPDFYGYRNFYLDQSGVLRATRDDRPANLQDSPFP